MYEGIIHVSYEQENDKIFASVMRTFLNGRFEASENFCGGESSSHLKVLTSTPTSTRH